MRNFVVRRQSPRMRTEQFRVAKHTVSTISIWAPTFQIW